MTEYLNGFTIISFNHKNKYVTLKAENYCFNNIIKKENNEEESSNNSQSQSSEIEEIPSNKIIYWLVFDDIINSYQIITTEDETKLPNSLIARTII